jgi:molecular chaperone DnaK
VEAAINDLKNVMEGEDVESIQSKTNGLAQVAMKLGEAAYKSQQQGTGGDAGASEAGKGDGKDDVVDADFTEVKDDDKKSA